MSDADVEISEPAPGEPDAPAPPPAPAVADAAWTDNTLARIAIRKAPTQAARPDVAELRSLDDANRAIRRASTREKVGDLMVRAAMTLTAGGIDAALVFVVREPIAIGWKGEVRDATPAVDAIAVPLDEPNAVARAFRRPGPELCELATASELDRKLVAAIGGPEPDCAIVAPVVIANHPVCLLYAHGVAIREHAELVRSLAEAASAAFVRLLRQAQR